LLPHNILSFLPFSFYHPSSNTRNFSGGAATLDHVAAERKKNLMCVSPHTCVRVASTKPGLLFSSVLDFVEKCFAGGLLPIRLPVKLRNYGRVVKPTTCGKQNLLVANAWSRIEIPSDKGMVNAHSKSRVRPVPVEDAAATRRPDGIAPLRCAEVKLSRGHAVRADGGQRTARPTHCSGLAATSFIVNATQSRPVDAAIPGSQPTYTRL
jgi:hypothetical protein